MVWATTAPWGTPAQQQHQQHMQAALDALLRGEEPAPLLAASGPLSPLLLIISLDFSLVLDLIRCVRGGLLFPHTYTFNLSSFSFSPPPKDGIPSASPASNAVAASAAAGALPSPAALVADTALATPRGARRPAAADRPVLRAAVLHAPRRAG